MIIRNFFLALACFFSCAVSVPIVSGQSPRLSSEEAVRLALASNFDIQLSNADAQIAKLNNTKGNAGMLPNVNLLANETFTLSAFQQKLANGNEFMATGAPFNNANAGVQLSWTLFDGRRMHIAKNRLEKSEQLGQLNLQHVVQSTVATVLVSYYDIVRSIMQENSISELILLNEERLRIAEARLSAGYAAQTDALQSRIDLNQRRVDLILQQTTTKTLKRTLNQLLNRSADTAFEVDETLESNYAPDFNQLKDKIYAQNPHLLSLQQTAEIAALQIEETRALGKARLTGLGQFNAVRTDNGTGFLLNNTQAGLTVGASLVVPLYTGGNVKRQVETSKIAANKALIEVARHRLTIESALDNQLENLQMQQQILGIEMENVAAARENLAISTERFRVGTTSGIEPQIAQNSLEQALVEKNLVLYNLKIAEIQLKLLAGEL